MKSFCLLFTAVVLLASCSKREGIPTESTYTFTNRVGERITFDVYGSDSDYYKNAHRLMRYSIPRDSTVAMVLDVGKVYWVDWYNADYSRSNWAQFNAPNGKNTPNPQFSVSEFSSSATATSTLRDTMRSILLNGGADTVSRWAVYYVVPPNDTARYWFTFSKRKTCSYRYKYRATDTVVSNANNFTIASYRTGTDGTPASFQFNQQMAAGVSFYFYWGQIYSLNNTVSRDTLMVNYYSSTNGPTTFALRRQ